MLDTVYRRLFAAYGDRAWWPADSAFEVMVGAVLTQNTAWTNVERAIDQLRAAQALDPIAILSADPEQLGQWIRSSGYFRVKTRRLKALCQAYLDAGGWAALNALDTPALRAFFLDIHGIGRETADDIVLYAFHRPVFVVDAYTRRILERLGWGDTGMAYDHLRLAIEKELGQDAQLFNNYHALLVRLGNAVCRPKPRCSVCPLQEICATGASR